MGPGGAPRRPTKDVYTESPRNGCLSYTFVSLVRGREYIKRWKHATSSNIERPNNWRVLRMSIIYAGADPLVSRSWHQLRLPAACCGPIGVPACPLNADRTWPMIL